MTNNDKIKMILERVSNDLIYAGKYIDENKLCSAEWIYAKARRDTLVTVLEEIEHIATKE